VYHFLTEPSDQVRYQEAAAATVRRGGTLLVATFASEGPTHCSGLSVARSSIGDLARDFRGAFALTRGFADVHRTPTGIEQHFSVAVLRRQWPASGAAPGYTSAAARWQRPLTMRASLPAKLPNQPADHGATERAEEEDGYVRLRLH
jgi:hypothetical protein